jgi:phenylacetate-CoA ligase
MVVIRGVNVYPSAVESVVRQSQHVAEFQVRQHQKDSMDELSVTIEPTSSAPRDLSKQIETRLRDTFSLRIPVHVAKPGSLPRHEFKAKRWIRE